MTVAVSRRGHVKLHLEPWQNIDMLNQRLKQKKTGQQSHEKAGKRWIAQWINPIFVFSIYTNH